MSYFLGLPLAASLGVAALLTPPTSEASAIREVEATPNTVINVQVARGVVTLLQLPDNDPMRFVAVGRSADCTKADDSWCVTAPADSNLIFAKPKSRASGTNNIEAVSAAGRKYSFRLVVGEERAATQRLVIRAAFRGSPALPGVLGSLSAGAQGGAWGAAPGGAAQPPIAVAPVAPVAPRPPAIPLATVIGREDPELVELRLQAGPKVVNSEYSLAIGDRSTDIVPTAVFDDALFTYLRMPGNREVPAVFHVSSDGEESMVNTRMEEDLLVVDRVSRQMRLRLGNQVVSVFNDAFDVEGRSVNKSGVTVDGVQRTVRPIPAPAAANAQASPAALLQQLQKVRPR
jgi:type IV secretion system protein VirB9